MATEKSLRRRAGIYERAVNLLRPVPLGHRICVKVTSDLSTALNEATVLNNPPGAVERGEGRLRAPECYPATLNLDNAALLGMKEPNFHIQVA